MFNIVFSKTALKQLEKLDKNIRERIIKSIERIRIRPYDYVKRLVGITYFSFRVGDYRVILDIKREQLLILIVAVGHRKNIYKIL